MGTDLMLLERHTTRLLATVAELDDLTSPSLCVGWSRAHVLTHLARNADGLSALVRAATEDSGETMYLSSAARDADIEAGVGRTLEATRRDVAESAARLAALLPRLAEVDPDRTVERTPGGQLFTVGSITGRRLREVVYHHVDLDAGFTFADVEPYLVEAFLADEPLRPDASTHPPELHDPAVDLLWPARGIRQEKR